MRVQKLLAAAFAVALVAAPARSEDETPAPKDIVGTAVGAKKFTSLVQAVQSADLADTLKGTGPFTLFAPTDDAFKALGRKMGEDKFHALLADRDRLHKLVMAHVVSGQAVTADDVMTMDGKMVNHFKVVVKGDKVRIGEATVTKADIQCKNGVIHVIDTVLVPDEK